MKPAIDTIPDSPGGLGGGAEQVDECYLTPTKENRLLARAIKQRWPIPDDQKGQIVRRLMDAVTRGTKTVIDRHGNEHQVPNDREAIAAARALVMMERQNQADEFAMIRVDPRLVQTCSDEDRADDTQPGMTIDSLEQFEAAVKVEMRMYHQKGNRGQV